MNHFNKYYGIYNEEIQKYIKLSIDKFNNGKNFDDFPIEDKIRLAEIFHENKELAENVVWNEPGQDPAYLIFRYYSKCIDKPKNEITNLYASIINYLNNCPCDSAIFHHGYPKNKDYYEILKYYEKVKDKLTYKDKELLDYYNINRGI